MEAEKSDNWPSHTQNLPTELDTFSSTASLSTSAWANPVTLKMRQYIPLTQCIEKKRLIPQCKHEG
jgi:hypothetical protein